MLGRRLLFHCDNIAVVSIVNSGSSRCPLVMCLVRALYHIAVSYNFDVKLIHVPGVDNIEADLLSRDLIMRFKSLFGAQYAAAPTPTSHGFLSPNFACTLEERHTNGHV